MTTWKMSLGCVVWLKSLSQCNIRFAVVAPPTVVKWEASNVSNGDRLKVNNEPVLKMDPRFQRP